MFDLMIESLIRWLNASHKAYDMTSCGLQLASKWYTDDGTLVTNTIEDMIALLEIVEQSSDWSGIRLNVGKYKNTAYMQNLQSFCKKTDKDDALKARLAHITLGGATNRGPHKGRNPSGRISRHGPHGIPMPGGPSPMYKATTRDHLQGGQPRTAPVEH